MMKLATLTLITCSALLLGCVHQATPTASGKPAIPEYDQGLQAEARGDFAAAREAFWRAWTKARDSGATPAYKSAVLYNWGRMSGYTCNWAQGERLLQESLDMETPLSGPTSSALSKRLFELARLHFDQGHFAQAAGFYQRAVAMAERLGVAQRDPIGLANAHDDWAQALQKSGQPDQAGAARVRAKTLRAQHPGQRARFVPRHYPKSCSR